MEQVLDLCLGLGWFWVQDFITDIHLSQIVLLVFLICQTTLA